MQAPLAGDWNHVFDIILGVVVGAVGWLVNGFVRRVDSHAEQLAKHSAEIRDTRQAISRIEGHLDLSPYPYTDGA